MDERETRRTFRRLMDRIKSVQERQALMMRSPWNYGLLEDFVVQRVPPEALRDALAVLNVLDNWIPTEDGGKFAKEIAATLEAAGEDRDA